MNIEELERILKILKQNDVSEFEMQEEGMTIKLSRGMLATREAVINQVHLQPAIQAVPASQAGTAPAATAAKEELDDSLVKVESPIVGTFYRKPAPDADPFVKEGDSVRKGDTLCIIEAMKLMNEIEAPCSGKIAKVCLTDGQVVEFGETLFCIQPD